MFHLRSVLTILFLLLGVFHPLSGQTVPSISISGFGAVKAPVGIDSTWSAPWLRVDFNTHPQKWMEVRAQHDVVHNELQLFYTRLHKKLSVAGNVFEGSLVFGQSLGPIADLYPGPRTLQTTAWPTTLEGYTINTIGTAIWMVGESWSFRAVSFGDRQKQAALSIHGASAFWESDAGKGFMVKPAEILPDLYPDFVHPTIVMARSQREDEGTRTVTSIEEYIQLGTMTRLWFQANHSFDEDTYLLAGVTVEYSPDSFVKAFYDGNSNEFDVAVTFAF